MKAADGGEPAGAREAQAAETYADEDVRDLGRIGFEEEAPDPLIGIAVPGGVGQGPFLMRDQIDDLFAETASPAVHACRLGQAPEELIQRHAKQKSVCLPGVEPHEQGDIFFVFECLFYPFELAGQERIPATQGVMRQTMRHANLLANIHHALSCGKRLLPLTYAIMSESGAVRHLAMIMDGNRRWAKAQGMPAIEGHRAGYEKMKQVGDWCMARGIEIVTVYAFSTENWKRSETEVGFLMSLLEHALDKELNYFTDRQIRLRILGRREGFSPKIVALMDKAEAATKDFEKMTLAICLGYGGRAELVDAVKEIVAEGMQPDLIDEQTIAKRLYWPNMPDPDMIVRTSGEERLSGFLLWESAYSELYWLKKNWPDLEETDIQAALDEFATRQRRYGA